MDDTLGKMLSAFMGIMFVSMLPSLLTLTQTQSVPDEAHVVRVIWS